MASSDSIAAPCPRQPSPLQQAVESLSALFEPGDYYMFRPIETWIDETGRKRSRVDYKAIRYTSLGIRDDSGRWHAAPDILAAVVRLQVERSQATKANIFFGVCPRFRAGGKFDLAWQIRVVRTLWADVDDCTVDRSD